MLITALHEIKKLAQQGINGVDFDAEKEINKIATESNLSETANLKDFYNYFANICWHVKTNNLTERVNKDYLDDETRILMDYMDYREKTKEIDGQKAFDELALLLEKNRGGVQSKYYFEKKRRAAIEKGEIVAPAKRGRKKKHIQVNEIDTPVFFPLEYPTATTQQETQEVNSKLEHIVPVNDYNTDYIDTTENFPVQSSVENAETQAQIQADNVISIEQVQKEIAKEVFQVREVTTNSSNPGQGKSLMTIISGMVNNIEFLEQNAIGGMQDVDTIWNMFTSMYALSSIASQNLNNANQYRQLVNDFEETKRDLIETRQALDEINQKYTLLKNTVIDFLNIPSEVKQVGKLEEFKRRLAHQLKEEQERITEYTVNENLQVVGIK